MSHSRSSLGAQSAFPQGWRSEAWPRFQDWCQNHITEHRSRREGRQVNSNLPTKNSPPVRLWPYYFLPHLCVACAISASSTECGLGTCIAPSIEWCGESYWPQLEVLKTLIWCCFWFRRPTIWHMLLDITAHKITTQSWSMPVLGCNDH